MMLSRLIPSVVLLLVPSAAGATVVAPLDLEALTDHAERIAVAKVESQAARFTASHDAIYTDVTMTVLVPVKGGLRAGDRITVRREGGEVGGLGMKVIGAARFTPGEETLVFLERRGAAWWTVGMAQGKLRVAVVDGKRVAIREAAGLDYLKPPRAEPAAQPLDDVLARIGTRLRSRP
jgi:hypothetical protein